MTLNNLWMYVACKFVLVSYSNVSLILDVFSKSINNSFPFQSLIQQPSSAVRSIKLDISQLISLQSPLHFNLAEPVIEGGLPSIVLVNSEKGGQSEVCSDGVDWHLSDNNFLDNINSWDCHVWLCLLKFNVYIIIFYYTLNLNQSLLSWILPIEIKSCPIWTGYIYENYSLFKSTFMGFRV